MRAVEDERLRRVRGAVPLTRRSKRWTFVAAIAGILLVLSLLSPAVANAWAFIAAIALALAWILGFTRTPRAVRAALRAAPRPAQPPSPRAEVPERDYRPGGAGKAVAVFLAAAGFMAAVSAGMLLFVIEPVSERIALAAPTALAALLFLHLAWITPRFRVRLSAWGIESWDMAGHSRMAWDEVVCAYTSQTYVSGTPYVSTLYVYSRDDVIAINSKLPGFDELCDLIRRHSPMIE